MNRGEDVVIYADFYLLICGKVIEEVRSSFLLIHHLISLATRRVPSGLRQCRVVTCRHYFHIIHLQLIMFRMFP